MAKPVKSTSKKRSPKKASVKKTIKKVASKKSPMKKAVSKKAAPKKLAKKAIKKSVPVKASKAAVKKAAPKKAVSTKKAVKPVKPKKNILSKVKTKKIKAASTKNDGEIESKESLNEQTSMANDYTEMIEANGGMPAENTGTTTDENNEDEIVNGQPDVITNANPVPIEKYSRPADPYHGNTKPVSKKSNIAPAGKKPLWNK